MPLPVASAPSVSVPPTLTLPPAVSVMFPAAPSPRSASAPTASTPPSILKLPTPVVSPSAASDPEPPASSEPDTSSWPPAVNSTRPVPRMPTPRSPVTDAVAASTVRVAWANTPSPISIAGWPAERVAPPCAVIIPPLLTLTSALPSEPMVSCWLSQRPPLIVAMPVPWFTSPMVPNVSTTLPALPIDQAAAVPAGAPTRTVPSVATPFSSVERADQLEKIRW